MRGRDLCEKTAVLRYFAIPLLVAGAFVASSSPAMAQGTPQIVPPITSPQSVDTQADTVRGVTERRLREKSAKEQSGKTSGAKRKN
jgi:hypothetical protein